MKVVVTNYTGDRSNWGCQATSRGLVRYLREACLPAGAEIVTVPLPKGHKIDRLHTGAHGRRIRAIYANPRPSASDLGFLEGLVRERFGDRVDAVRGADLVVFQGEGSIGPTDYFRNVRLFGLPYVARRVWSRPVVAMNQTLYASAPRDRAALAQILEGFDLVGVREVASFVFGRDLGLGDRLACCPDMAFRGAEMATAAPMLDLPEAYFCVTGSAAQYLLDGKRMAETVRAIAEATGLAPVFCFSRGKDRDWIGDGLGNVRVIGAEDVGDEAGMLPILARARFVFGGRYHTAVSALSQTTPVILLPGNTFKSEGLGDLFGIPMPVFATEDVAGITAAARAILADEADLRARIADGLRGIGRMHDDFARLIPEVIAGQPVNAGAHPSLRPTTTWREGDAFRALYRTKNRQRGGFGLFQGRALRRLRAAPDFAARMARTMEDLP